MNLTEFLLQNSNLIVLAAGLLMFSCIATMIRTVHDVFFAASLCGVVLLGVGGISFGIWTNGKADDAVRVAVEAKYDVTVDRFGDLRSPDETVWVIDGAAKSCLLDRTDISTYPDIEVDLVCDGTELPQRK